ncbi:MAG: hypothetical protein NZV14_06900 [Bryobacteraceae bacterium]|nr:hypothetical protein [Bryobacteraceae bacterium]MDW8377870.1 hypothetical protein [Bryobacterales bacterium]
MAAKVTRRQLAVLAALPLGAAESLQPQGQPLLEDDLAAQRETLRRNREQMAKVSLPMGVEPAVIFKA